MLSEEKLRTLPPKAADFWRRAQQFVMTKKTDWELIRVPSIELDAWASYFGYHDWKPFAIRQVEQGKLNAIVMPARFPEWFDPTYTPPPGALPKIGVSTNQLRHLRLTMKELRAKYGDWIGPSQIPAALPAPRQVRADEIAASEALRALMRRKSGEPPSDTDPEK
jgi:hypothetical protein